jgi:putative DNA primase/helicase
MGDYSANTSFDTFDAGRRSDATNDLAALKGRRLVTVIESEEDRRLAEARVKSVTGGDLVTARFLYGEFFSYRPEFKIWMAMNHKPRIKGTDRGIWRRIQLIPFTQNFEGREDRSLRETLRAELPGILNWALDGLRAWHAKGLAQCTTITNATQSYQAESDQVGRWMHEQTIAGRQYMAQASVAYANYVRWCVDNGEVPDSQSMWGRQLTERGFTRERRRGDWQLIGFGLLAPESLTEQPQDGSDSVQASITTPETDTSLCAPPTGLTVEVEPEVEPSVEPDDKDLPSGWSMSHSSKGWWITNGAGIGEYHRSAAEAVEMAWAHEEAAGMVQRC